MSTNQCILKLQEHIYQKKLPFYFIFFFLPVSCWNGLFKSYIGYDLGCILNFKGKYIIGERSRLSSYWEQHSSEFSKDIENPSNEGLQCYHKSLHKENQSCTKPQDI